MTKRAIIPRGHFAAKGYSHGLLVEGGKLLFISGQVALDANRELVGTGDLRQQTEQALHNLTEVLAAAGATPADVVKLNIYVVDYDPSDLEIILECLGRVFPEEDAPTGTLVGVTALGREGWLIEIEAVAAPSY